MNFLIDTNIWLERLLEQEKSEMVKELLDIIPSENLSISDFSLHSIGVILHRLGKINIFDDFINDLFLNGDINYLSIEPMDNIEVAKLIRENKFDYDDAYQVVISLKFNISIVTFDKDFKKSGMQTISPIEAAKIYNKQL
jgi:predicted nucleic acid-binding protein